MPRFAANLSLLFTELPFLDRFAAAAAAGFRAVEFLFPYDFAAADIRQRLDASGLQLVLHNFPPGNWDAGDRGMACDPKRIDEFRASVAQGLDYAQVLGAPQLHCLAGNSVAGVALEVQQQTYVDNLVYAARACQTVGKRLLIEPINGYDFPGYFLNRTAQAVAILDRLKAAGINNAGLQYDIYHAQRSEGELAATVEKYLAYIAHIQLADNPGRHEPGSGEIRFDFVLPLLDRLGYAGWVGCEYKPAAGTVAGLGWLKNSAFFAPPQTGQRG